MKRTTNTTKAKRRALGPAPPSSIATRTRSYYGNSNIINNVPTTTTTTSSSSTAPTVINQNKSTSNYKLVFEDLITSSSDDDSESDEDDKIKRKQYSLKQQTTIISSLSKDKDKKSTRTATTTNKPPSSSSAVVIQDREKTKTNLQRDVKALKREQQNEDAKHLKTRVEILSGFPMLRETSEENSNAVSDETFLQFILTGNADEGVPSTTTTSHPRKTARPVSINANTNDADEDMDDIDQLERMRNDELSTLLNSSVDHRLETRRLNVVVDCGKKYAEKFNSLEDAVQMQERADKFLDIMNTHLR
jgi:hypothetical protein